MTMWVKLPEDESHGVCVSDACGRPACWSLEVGGIGSKYCTQCKDDIAEKAFDGQIERDIKAGKLDWLGDEALEARRAGKTTPFPPRAEPAS